jgi:hypothetical protein
MGSQDNTSRLELEIAGWLLGDDDGIAVGNAINLEYLLAWAKFNGVLYVMSIALEKAAPEGSFKMAIQKVVDDQRSKMDDLVKETRELIALCQRNGLNLIPMKTFLQFPYVDDDLDIILVENDNIARCRGLLEENEYRYLKSRSSLREPKKRFYFPKGEDNSGLRIHLHWAVSWNGVDYLDIRTVFARRREINVDGCKIPIPSVEDEILIMAAHAVHENRYILLGEMLQLQHLTQQENLNWEYILASAQSYNWSAGLYLFLVLATTIMKKLNQEIPIPVSVLARLAQNSSSLHFMERSLSSWGDSGKDLRFPVIMPPFLTSFAFLDKYLLDLKEKKKSAREMGRELLAYTAVDWAVFWRFGKEMRELNRLKQTKTKK